MKVYVVLHGELHEGGSVVSVNRQKSKAVKTALGVRRHFRGGWQREDSDFWVNGCDFVTIEEHEVK